MNNLDKTKKEAGQRLKSCRLAKNLTQEQLSEKIGIQTKSYSNIESGVRLFSVEVLLKLMAELDVSSDYILTGNIPDDTPVSSILNNMSQENIIRAQAILKIFADAARN